MASEVEVMASKFPLVSSWSFGAPPPSIVSGSVTLHDEAPHVAKGTLLEVEGVRYRLVWARDWDGFRKGRRVRPRTVFFRAKEVRGRDDGK